MSWISVSSSSPVLFGLSFECVKKFPRCCQSGSSVIKWEWDFQWRAITVALAGRFPLSWYATYAALILRRRPILR